MKNLQSIISNKLKSASAAKFLIATSLLTLVACGEDTVSTTQEQHLEPVAIALENHETGEYLAVIYDEAEMPDSVTQNSFEVAVGDTLELHVVTLCLENNALVECDEHDDEHDHTDMATEESSEEVAESEAEFSLQVTLSSNNIAGMNVNSEGFEVAIWGLKSGKTNLNVEIWHGSHPDISGKVFEVIVP